LRSYLHTVDEVEINFGMTIVNKKTSVCKEKLQSENLKYARSIPTGINTKQCNFSISDGKQDDKNTAI